MINIRLEFPAGRYHATPYGRHVNEGVPEWPPSPYRLLRALFDVWKRKCPDLLETDVESLLAALAESPPEFHLPPATATHTRSYLSANTYDASDKNLVFDGFLVFERPAVCCVVWPALDLTDKQRDILRVLLQNLNYLGRSESWISAALDTSIDAGLISCAPLGAGASIAGEPVPVACVLAQGEYKGKQPWLHALTASTTDVINQRASAPPLLQAVRYFRPEHCIETSPITEPRRRLQTVDAVLLALDSTVLPLATATLEISEQIRSRLMGAHKKRMNGDESLVSDLFSGKNDSGQKRLDHGHLYILPLSNPNSRIDQVLLVSRLHPWTRDELDAVNGVRRLWQRDDRPDVRCAVAWQGSLETLPSVCSRVRTVESATPFVPPRHWRQGRDFRRFIQDEARRECRNHGLPEPFDVFLESRIRSSHFECLEYRRNRKNDPVRPGYSLRLVFAEPVMAPFAIGYAAHFGLGLFRQAE
jgi:CRISPR-associated protein Csb2